MAARNSERVKTFTISLPGQGTLDEAEHARLIARHFDTDHTELVAETSAASLIPMLARQFDEPMADSSMIPTFLVSQLVQPHCPVALGGDGGDELFGGYQHYSDLLRLESQLRWIPRRVRQPVAMLAELGLPIGLRGRNWLLGMEMDFEYGLPIRATLFDPTARRRLMRRGGHQWQTIAETDRRWHTAACASVAACHPYGFRKLFARRHPGQDRSCEHAKLT